MENKFRRYIERASRIKNNICIWKYISDGQGNHEGRMRKCNDECDGTNTNCEYYINNIRSMKR